MQSDRDILHADGIRPFFSMQHDRKYHIKHLTLIYDPLSFINITSMNSIYLASENRCLFIFNHRIYPKYSDR